MVSSATSTEAAGLRRHPELYFDDGDIVLQAHAAVKDDQQNYQLFCVHQAVLSTHSPVFSNLFADASASPDSTYDGRPLITMSDEAGDLMHLLLYLYDPGRYLLRSSHPDTAVELKGAVTLAGKYLLDKVRSTMIQRIVQDWPTTLHDWDISEAARRSANHLAMHAYLPASHRSELANRKREPVSAIVFAQEHGCAEILPAAFYSLASIEVGWDWSDDKRGHELPIPRARWALCDRDNLVRYIVGRKSLEGRSGMIAYDLNKGTMLCAPCRPSAPVFEVNVDEWPCLRSLRAVRERVWGTRPTHDPLGRLLELDNYDRRGVAYIRQGPDALCHECRNSFGRWVHEERAKLWARLPKIFQLE